jgi:hypothetical protein
MCINSLQIFCIKGVRIRNFTNKDVRIRIKESKKSADQDPYSTNVLRIQSPHHQFTDAKPSKQSQDPKQEPPACTSSRQFIAKLIVGYTLGPKVNKTGSVPIVLLIWNRANKFVPEEHGA